MNTLMKAKVTVTKNSFRPKKERPSQRHNQFKRKEEPKMKTGREEIGGGNMQDPSMPPPAPEHQSVPQSPIRNEIKVGRNDPCPCGSGKKFKSCHGKD